MQVVINISEEDYEGLKKKDEFNDMYLNHYEKLIVHGTPLLKGHGDLKDMEDIYEILEGWEEDTEWIVDRIDEAPTIIEADE